MRNGSRVFDADGHVMEPTTLWWEYLDPPFRSEVVPDTEHLGERNGALLPLAGGKPTFYGSEKMVEYLRTGSSVDGMVERFGEIAERGFDPVGLLKGMDVEGVDVAAVYPSFALHVPYTEHLRGELATALARAYNRWIGEFAAEGGGRIIPVGLAPLHDPQAIAAEMRRTVAQDGVRALMLRPNPVHGRTMYHADHEPVFAVAEDLDVPLIVHEGRGANVPFVGRDRFDTWYASHAACHPMEAMLALAGLIVEGVFDRHPRLRVAFLESGTGWLPYWLDRMDEHHEMWAEMERPDLELRPSEYFQRQCAISGETDDPFISQVVEAVGADHVMWASDFPHMECKWPNSLSSFLESTKLHGDDLEQVLWDTPRRFYGLSS